MKLKFKSIGLIGKHEVPECLSTLADVLELVQRLGARCLVEQQSAVKLSLAPELHCTREDLGKACDLIIVVGGDGSLLHAARAVVDNGCPLTGINRGRLGFLTDLSPKTFEAPLTQLLQGEYEEETRFLVETTIQRGNKTLSTEMALNDTVLYSGAIARMIEFDVEVNGHFMHRLRADGIIASTPTGSTAYALSAGGPILAPTLDAMVLVPLCPHTLSARPIVVPGDATIVLRLTDANDHHPHLSCDGQTHQTVEPGDSIIIKRKEKSLKLLHPRPYDYFHVLRTKLGWASSH